jgi:hypothetical protein
MFVVGFILNHLIAFRLDLNIKGFVGSFARK